ncbi:hypothetical protein NQ318_021459 [Aromia moschata]|uniref:Clip domain-containing protein n=1 Tax=Aromia moschata TaxID=1265417 RepID=A0AAV8ZF39_9CUCU|nr:hypothetical protein NQ318_021459 [Aromia moschata]
MEIFGNPCTVNDDSQGVCKFLTECPAALEMLEQGVFPENICGFRGTESVVCCHAVGALSPPTTRMTRPMGRPAIKPTPKLTPKPTPKPTTTLLATRSSGDRSNEKCKEYAKYPFDLDPSPILTVEPQYAHTLVCPFEKIPLIVGGTLASRQEFPHMN